MAITTEFLIIISKQYQGDKWWEQRESKRSSSSLSQSKISMYTSAVFLGKKQNKNKKMEESLLSWSLLLSQKRCFLWKITKTKEWI